MNDVESKPVTAATGSATIRHNLDGTTTEYFAVAPDEATLLALLRELFEEHWREVVFGPCIEGAVFEGRLFARPRVSTLDGYVTVSTGGDEAWHFHLCIGPHRGTRNRPTPPALAAWRRCARAAFFRDSDRAGRHSSWGFRMWNGRDEQMMTVFFPNPWLDPARMRIVRQPDYYGCGCASAGLVWGPNRRPRMRHRRGCTDALRQPSVSQESDDPDTLSTIGTPMKTGRLTITEGARSRDQSERAAHPRSSRGEYPEPTTACSRRRCCWIRPSCCRWRRGSTPDWPRCTAHTPRSPTPW